ncbi:hypothetical protein FACS189449_03780 [Alphaproteobacteria bacterium]|nr:hypothetical protein FACS189449_03780 [Alphaproteobacteria bacterium]
MEVRNGRSASIEPDACFNTSLNIVLSSPFESLTYCNEPLENDDNGLREDDGDDELLEDDGDDELLEYDGDNGLREDDGDGELREYDGDDELLEYDGDNGLREDDGDGELREYDGDDELLEDDDDDELREDDGDDELLEDDGNDEPLEDDGDDELLEDDGDNGLREDDGDGDELAFFACSSAPASDICTAKSTSHSSCSFAVSAGGFVATAFAFGDVFLGSGCCGACPNCPPAWFGPSFAGFVPAAPPPLCIDELLEDGGNDEPLEDDGDDELLEDDGDNGLPEDDGDDELLEYDGDELAFFACSSASASDFCIANSTSQSCSSASASDFCIAISTSQSSSSCCDCGVSTGGFGATAFAFGAGCHCGGADVTGFSPLPFPLCRLASLAASTAPFSTTDTIAIAQAPHISFFISFSFI